MRKCSCGRKTISQMHTECRECVRNRKESETLSRGMSCACGKPVVRVKSSQCMKCYQRDQNSKNASMFGSIRKPSADHIVKSTHARIMRCRNPKCNCVLRSGSLYKLCSPCREREIRIVMQLA